MLKKYIKLYGIILIIICSFLLISFVKDRKMHYIQLPNLQVIQGNTNINSFIANYDYEGLKKYISGRYEENKYSIDVEPLSIIEIKFDKIPHEYTINLIDNNSHIDINEYKFTAPSIEGYYTFNVISRWYDKGDINYKFTINVKNKE